MLATIRAELKQQADSKRAKTSKTFFKHCKDDIFLGVPVPVIRKIAKNFKTLPLGDIKTLTESNTHEERTMAHAILRLQFDAGDDQKQEQLFKFYLRQRKHIRDWDGVDDSAPYIVGKFLLNRDKTVLYEFAQSSHLWTRRIAIVATWWFIRNDQIDDTMKLAEILLGDEEDLIHKATGWMLREAGKRDEKRLLNFLDKYATSMPRTMLRYAIERLTKPKKMHYMKK